MHAGVADAAQVAAALVEPTRAVGPLAAAAAGFWDAGLAVEGGGGLGAAGVPGGPLCGAPWHSCATTCTKVASAAGGSTSRAGGGTLGPGPTPRPRCGPCSWQPTLVVWSLWHALCAAAGVAGAGLSMGLVETSARRVGPVRAGARCAFARHAVLDGRLRHAARRSAAAPRVVVGGVADGDEAAGVLGAVLWGPNGEWAGLVARV